MSYTRFMNSTGTNTFTERVYATVKSIPLGKVATYGQVAALAGSPGAARAVGMAMRNNPFAPVVPCHRVVGSDGKLTGFSGKDGVVGKRHLLETEGVKFVGERVDLSASKM